MNSSDLIYAYPIALKLEKDEELSEAFVTFDEPNLFNEPYDNLGIKLAASGAYLVGLVGSGIQYSFVAYEVNGYAASFRTAINQLVSSLYFLHAIYSTFVSGLDLFRVWYGPLPIEFCQFCLLMKGTIGYAMPFTMAGIVILKFFYICIWQRYRPIDDDFVARVIITFAYFISFYLQLVKNMAPGKPVYNTIFCTGVYQPSFDDMPKKIPMEMGMLIPILASQILTPIIHQKMKKLTEDFKAKNQNTPDHESLSLYVIINILFIFVVVIIALCNASEPSRWNEYPANLYLFYIHFITGLQAGVVPAILIWKKMKIQFIKEMIYEVFG